MALGKLLQEITCAGCGLTVVAGNHACGSPFRAAASNGAPAPPPAPGSTAARQAVPQVGGRSRLGVELPRLQVFPHRRAPVRRPRILFPLRYPRTRFGLQIRFRAALQVQPSARNPRHHHPPLRLRHPRPQAVAHVEREPRRFQRVDHLRRPAVARLNQVPALGIRRACFHLRHQAARRKNGLRHRGLAGSIHIHRRRRPVGAGERRFLPAGLTAAPPASPRAGPHALGCALSYTFIRSSSDSCVYFCVVDSDACPSSS